MLAGPRHRFIRIGLADGIDLKCTIFAKVLYFSTENIYAVFKVFSSGICHLVFVTIKVKYIL